MRSKNNKTFYRRRWLGESDWADSRRKEKSALPYTRVS